MASRRRQRAEFRRWRRRRLPQSGCRVRRTSATSACAYGRASGRGSRCRWISRFVALLERATHAAPIPVTMTCGAAEENLANNRLMRDALSAHGYPVRWREVPGGHDWPAWRRGLDPHLLDLIGEATR